MLALVVLARQITQTLMLIEDSRWNNDEAFMARVVCRQGPCMRGACVQGCGGGRRV